MVQNMLKNMVHSCFCSLALTKIIDSKCIISFATRYCHPTFNHYRYLKPPPQQTIRYFSEKVHTPTIHQQVPGSLHKVVSSASVRTENETDDNFDYPRDDHRQIAQDDQNPSIVLIDGVWRFIKNNKPGLSVSQTKLLVRRYPEFKNLPIDTMHERISYLLSRNLTEDRIYSMPWLLLKTPEVLESEVDKIASMLELDHQSARAFVHLSLDRIMLIQFIWFKEQSTEPELVGGLKYKNRLDYIADRLNCKPVIIADMVAKVKRLPEVPFRKIVNVLNVLLEGGVRAEDIIIDPWIFLHNTPLMEKRMAIAHDHKLLRIKPWLLRTSEESFESYISRDVKERSLLLGHPTLKSFLQRRLNCTADEAEIIFSKVPSIKTASAMKINEMITYLFSQGYTSMHILKVPRILAHSKDTIHKRIMILATHQYAPTSLATLCSTSKKWKLLLKRFKPARNKINKV